MQKNNQIFQTFIILLYYQQIIHQQNPNSQSIIDELNSSNLSISEINQALILYSKYRQTGNPPVNSTKFESIIFAILSISDLIPFEILKQHQSK